VQQATKVELLINLKTANTLGITVTLPLSGTRLLACLILAPQRGYDEPGILSYAISSELTRYADDWVITCTSATEARALSDKC
jgi:hypothetical protein